MQNCNNIKKEIEDLLSRRSALELEREKVVSNFESEKQAVISGKGEMSKVQNCTNQMIAYDETLSEMSAQIEAKLAELEIFEAIEKREAVLNKIVKLDADSEAKAKALAALFSEFDSFMARWQKVASEAFNDLNEKQNLFRDYFREIVPLVNSALRQDLPETESQIETTLEELKRRGAKLSVLQSEVFNSWHQHRLQDLSGGFTLPKTKYSHVANQVIQGFEQR